MDRLAEAVAAYLCRHRSVGLLRLTLDLTRRRLDLFAEIGAAEVMKAPCPHPRPAQTPGGESPSERRYIRYAKGAGPVRMGGGGCQLDRPALLTNPTPSRLTPNPAKPPTAKNGVLLHFFLVFAFARRRRMAS